MDDNNWVASLDAVWAEDMVALAKNVSAFNAGDARDRGRIRLHLAVGRLIATEISGCRS